MDASGLLPNRMSVLFFLLLLPVGDCIQMEPNLCDSSCRGLSSDPSYQTGVRYTYRYGVTISTGLHGSNAGRNGLALDCLVDIEVVSRCHLMMQIRNPQIKRLSPQKEHSVQHLKSLRESLERTRLKFSLRGGKVTALCLQEGEQVWALNIKRALLSMLQTSRMTAERELEEETDVYGTCISKYERRGPVLLKTRDLKRCQQPRLEDFWPRSVSLSDDTPVQSELRCVQKHGSTVLQEVNCTESVVMATWSRTPEPVKTQTVSSLVLLRAQPGTPSAKDPPGVFLLTDLQFEDEEPARPGKDSKSTPQQAAQTVRMLCGLASDPQLVSQEFLQLTFQLRDLTLDQLQTLWQETSFKCRDDWQPLLEALPACGSESCVLLLTDLLRRKEVDQEQAHGYLTSMALIPHPSAAIIDSINALLEVPELQPQALLSGSSLVHQLCQRSQSSCAELPQVETFIEGLKETLKEGCEDGESAQSHKLLYALKSVGNVGLAAPVFIPLLNHFLLGRPTAVEIRLAAVHAFRRFPCSADRSVLLQLYRTSQEDPEVRIAAYQQLLRCPDRNVFEVVKKTLRKETSSQVGSYVWSHLTHVLRSEDPVKQGLAESLPDDIITRDFEAEFLKYSSYSDYTASSGFGVTNVETSLIFSPKSFLPRSATVNLTVYLHGRAHNLLELDLHVENAEPLLRKFFDHQTHDSDGASGGSWRTRRADEAHDGEKRGCSTPAGGFLERARALLFGSRRPEGNGFRCRVGVKVFGSELSVFSCDDVSDRFGRLSLSAAGLVVKLLKGQEVQLNQRAVLLTDQLVLPSLSGLPLKLGVNLTSLLSLRLKGDVDYRDASHFSLAGFIKPTAHVGLSARMGVDGVLGRAAVDWVSQLRSSTSLDGSLQLQEGRDVKITLNTPEDVMDIFSLSSRWFHLTGDHREEMKGPKSRVQKTSCTPKTWSKMMGWQLCSNASYPSFAAGASLPLPGPAHLSLRLLKLDRGLHRYLLEAAYSLTAQSGSWLPREASIHLLLATPQSSVPRDASLDLVLRPRRLLLRLHHPLKTVHLQGQLDRDRTATSGKLELLMDGVRYFILGLVDAQNLPSEQRTRYHLESKLAAHGPPMILSANVTRGSGGKTGFSATVRNVFRKTASLSVVLERRRDGATSQYSVEAELLLPGAIGIRMLGLMEQKASLWSSMLRLKYGVGGDARHLRQECSTSQRLRSERLPNLTYVMRGDHEFFCSNTAAVNHKIHLRHEESPRHTKSSLDVSYGKHWDEINNKRTVFLSQSFRNQSAQNHSSYRLEFHLQVPERNLNYRTQLLHSHLRQVGSESSTHLKINYNGLTPLVAGLCWKSPPRDGLGGKWEGAFNLDAPWLNVRRLLLEGFYRGRGGETEARLKLHTPTVTYIQAGGWVVMATQSVKVSTSLVSLWTPSVSLEASASGHALQVAFSCGEHNVSLDAALSAADKVLKKRRAALRVVHLNAGAPPTELHLEGVVEELRRDKKVFQKTAALQLRCDWPLQVFPQTLRLRGTFTVNLPQRLYILESRAGFHGDGEAVHTLTLGYRPRSPFVCSALTHPFSADVIPSDSEVCVGVASDQTQKDVEARLRIAGEDRMTLTGQVLFNPLRSERQEIQVKANFSHQLQLKLPSSAVLEGNVCWERGDVASFRYQAAGRLRVERTECELSARLNASAGSVELYSKLSHPFKAKIPRALEVRATAGISSEGGGGSSLVQVRADGKDRVRLDAWMRHAPQGGDQSLELRVNVSQSLLPVASDLRVGVAANVTSDSVSLRGSYSQGGGALLAQVGGSLRHAPGLQLMASGDLRRSGDHLTVLPPLLGVDVTLGQSDGLVEGQIRLRGVEVSYRAELRHHRDPPESLDGEDEEGGTKHSTVARDWLCVWVDEEHFCVNLSRRLGDWRRVEVHTGLSHTSHLLNATGVPSSSDAQVRWLQDGGRLSVLLELQAGPEHLRAEINGGRSDRGGPGWGSDFRLQHRLKSLKKRGVAGSIEARTHYQTETDGLNAGLALHVDDNRLCDVLFHVGSKNSSSTLEVSLWQQTKLLQGLVPTSFQMNCTGGATADGLDARCYGNVAGRPAETSADVSITRSDCSSRLRSVVTVGGGQKASLHLRSTCLPHLRLEASVEHSIIAVETLGLPPHAAITLSVSTPRPVHVEGGLEVGPCYFGGNLGETRQVEEDQWLYSVNLTSYCPPLPTASLTLRGLLSVAPQRLNLTSSLRADDQQVSLDLSRSTGPQRFSGTIQNSFLGWRRRGLPQVVQVEATTPRGPKQAGGLFVKAGTCSVRTNGFMQTEDGTKWVWALESRCPPLKTRVNVSVWTDPRGVWTATLDTDLEGQTGSLRLNARPPPELSVDAELRHNFPALRDLPQHVRLRVTGRAAKQRYDAGALVQVEGCAVGAAGGVMSQGGLRGALRYHNNCTVIQEWGGPDRMLASGALVVSPALTEAQVSMAIDDRELEAAVALKKTKDKHEASLRLNHSVPLLETLGLPNDAAVAMNSGSHDNGSVYFLLDCSTGNQTMVQEATATRTSGAVRVTAGFIHTLNPLKELGVPANSSIQAELGSLDGTALTLRLQSGGQQVGMNLQTKCFPRVKEVRGTMWNGWSWLQLRGVPRNLEGLCSVQGVWSQFQSRVRLAVDGHRLMASGLNVSEAAGRLELLVSYPPPASDRTGTRPVLDVTLTSRFRGPLWSVSVDLQGPDWGVQAIGDLEGTGGSKESRVTLKHTRRGHTSPALQVEAWGRLTESQLRCSIAVNPELSSSLALILQGRRLPHSKDLMVKVVQNIPGVLAYLPSQVNVRSLMNHSGSAVAGLVEVSSGRRRLWAQGELAALPSGFRQAAELRHSFPQLKPLPRTVAVKTVYEARNWSHQVQHGAMWGNQELYLSGLYSTPPSPEMGTQTIRVQVRSIPRWTNLEAVMETSAHRRLDSVLLGWTRHGRLEEVGVLSSWSRSAEVNETRLEVKQPFLLPLGQMSLHVRSQGERRNSQQTLLWWNISAPVNISLNVSRQWQNGSSRGQACALFSTPQTAVSPVKGCVSASQEGNSYSQNAELRWDDRSVQQGVKYQRSPGGVHHLQVTLGLDKVSPTPCPSHHILTKIQTNFRDRLEHSVLLSLCPTHPSFLWEGSHRVSSGEELFHTRSLLSVAGRPDPIRFTVALRNSSSALGSNTSLLSESRTRSWSLEVEGSVLMGPRGSGVLVQAQLDDRQNVWLNGTLEGRCLQTAAGSALGSGLKEVLTATVCAGEERPSLTLDVQKRDGSAKPERLASVFVGSANQRLTLRGRGCLESLTGVEARVRHLTSHLRGELSDRIGRLERLLVAFRRKTRDRHFLQELSAAPLHAFQRAQALLGRRDDGLLAPWLKCPLRGALTHSLPRLLGLLHHASLLAQQELRRPLATLAGVYHDVKGQRVEALWREAVSQWADGMGGVLPALLGNPQLGALAQTGVASLKMALDAVGQYTTNWLETQLATALSGVRKRLTSVYKFSPSECLVAVSLPLSPLPWSRVAEAGLVEVLLEEWLLKPLQTLAAVRPAAEFYRLKRRIMDSPFRHRALLVAHQFAVTFDGHLLELPGSCPLLLAQDASADPSFTLMLGSDPHGFLMVGMDNNTIDIQRNGQVTANCRNVTHTFHGDNGVAVRVASNVVKVSNQKGVSLSCDLRLELCSFTLDGWMHGRSSGLLGTNDNEAGNDRPLPDGSQAATREAFYNSWSVGQGGSECVKPPGVSSHPSHEEAPGAATCDLLFSSPDSPLSSCFRVVDPGRFLSACVSSSSSASCRLASAFVHLCQQNHVQLDVPTECLEV